MITTTLNRIREHSPCVRGWRTLLEGLGKTEADDEPLPYSTIARINGLDDALWCCRVEPQHGMAWRLYAVRCARRVQHLMGDPRSLAALDVAERHANKQAADADLTEAGAEAWAAADAEAGDVDGAAARAAAWATAEDPDKAGAWAESWAVAAAAAAAAAAAGAGAAAEAEMLADFIAAVNAPSPTAALSHA